MAYAGSRKYRFSAYLTYPLKNRFAAALGWRTKGGAGEPLNACVSLDAPVKEGGRGNPGGHFACAGRFGRGGPTLS